jgi:hypothetical protein
MFGVESRLSRSAKPMDGIIETKITVAASTDYRLSERMGASLLVLSRGSLHYPTGSMPLRAAAGEPTTRGETQSSLLIENRLSLSV